MKNVLGLLPRLLEASGDHEELAESAAKIAWRHAAGEGLCRSAVPQMLSHGTLTIAVADPIWQKQLRAMSRELLARLNSVLGRDLIRRLEFRIEPRAIQKARQTVEPATFAESVKPVPPEVQAAAATIEDEALRQRFLGAAASVISRRTMRQAAR
jgi:hypothetical protein